MSADDLVVFNPGAAGQQVFNVCSVDGQLEDVKYYSKKSVIMICQTKKDRPLKFPDSKLSGVLSSTLVI